MTEPIDSTSSDRHSSPTSSLLRGTIAFAGCLAVSALFAQGFVMPFGVAFLHVAAVVLAAGAVYSMIDGVGRGPVEAVLALLIGSALFTLAVAGLLSGYTPLRWAVVFGLALHAGWSLLHHFRALPHPRHEWLPLAWSLLGPALVATALLVA